MHAMRALTPAAHRSSLTHAVPIPKTVSPLLSTTFTQLLKVLGNVFPVSSLRKTKEDLLSLNASSAASVLPSAVYRPRLLLSGAKGMGQSQLGAALLHHLEEFPVFALDTQALLADPFSKVNCA